MSHTRHDDARSAADAPDDTLRQQIRQSAPPTDLARTQALEDRVMVQWQQRHSHQRWTLASAGGRSVLRLAAHPVRVGAALVLVAALALAAWTQRPDPVMEELMQLDVLSQLTMGEM